MLTHLLVPLDGSSLAEAALPVAVTLAGALSAKITLLHLIEEQPDPQVHGQRHLTGSGEAEEYLAGLRRRPLLQGLDVALHVHQAATRDVAEGIVAHQDELHPDLIVMCTHGPSGISRVMHGSLAQQVVGLGDAPLLLVRPGLPAISESYRLQRILVALDGRPEHEGGLILAKTLAVASHSHLHLLSVIPGILSLAGRQATLSRFLPGATFNLHSLTAGRLEEYLQQQLDRVLGSGLPATAEIVHGKVPERIVAAADHQKADLIVLATHGKAGTRAFWDNSVAVSVQARTAKPLMLVPV